MTCAFGTFYFQQSAALYGSTDPRYWDFFTGTNFETASRSSTISDAVNPNNANDQNNDTTWRCNNSPTGIEATYAPSGSGYSQKNYCDLVGVWVDPDTGDWYGLVHNEFTPEPFGAYSFSHYDAIDFAVSTNQGKVWTILGHAITSPYSTKRGDTTAFPNSTFDYGDGDPRLFVDTASGYFYVYYGSRIIGKASAGGSMDGLAHVARAPMSSKMAAGSWRKWYNGTWTEPGVGGRESNMVPVTSANTNGYTPTSADYDPANTGTTDQQIASGELPSKSPLFVMNIAYDAYLGLYIGEPEVISGTAPQQFYVTDDLVLAQVSGSTATTSVASGTGSNLEAWSFTGNGDGSYRITNASTGQALGVDSGTTSTRAWGAKPTVTTIGSGGPTVGQQWFVIGSGTYRLVNRYSGLVLGLSSDSTRLAETTPTRSWTNTTGNAVGGTRSATEQTLTFTQVGAGTGDLTGTHTVIASGKALDDPGHSTSPGTQLITWAPNRGVNQNWAFTRQSDGSYQIVNGESNLCMDVSGGSLSAGAQVIQWTCTGNSNQRWIVTALSGGGYTIAAKHSGLLLTTASTADGSLVTQQTNTNSTLQHWAIS